MENIFTVKLKAYAWLCGMYFDIPFAKQKEVLGFYDVIINN